MTSILLKAGIKLTCRRLLMPIGLLAICNFQTLAASPHLSVPVAKNKFAFTVSGTVTDGNQLPIPGVSVYDKRTRKTTVTDGNGRYSIALDEAATLVFSFVGYDTQEI
ncbi:carboxypeptidase-like regulatory domain-containing protein [Pedobacter sp. Leaf194]|uniref:carboxypeptidase-like regulatory domain-containing protein n=1 Tax=Pedobacter sp. Leaf194 TaxID=1736297 RepID=UPI000AFE5DAD|nr:carboxypeptidase-like regulatory domain-containing protein [Pedobacter sp. Leaf194]